MDIFAKPARGISSSGSSIWEPDPNAVHRPPPAPPPPDAALDARLLTILNTPPRPGETIAATYQRKEQLLGDAFSTLDIPRSRAMHARLSSPATGDTLAEKFSRLTSDRRGRLLAFLADVRRRLATGGRR
jgi:hypothetical protein